MEERTYYVYILTNWNNKLLYIGVTNNLVRRVYEHQNKLVPGFTEKYRIGKLVWFESTHSVTSAIAKEKQLKGWRREKKRQLIELMNPAWTDLSGCLQ